MNTTSISSYQKHYSTNKLWEKLKNCAASLGKKTVYNIMILYYVMVDSNTPLKYKVIIAGALGYLILPLDAIPDTIPVIGFTDDIAAITAAYKAVEDCVTCEIEHKAQMKISSWFN